ncbi:MAG: hypothetical protein HOG12_17835 [Alphaproteobacteria bacterium]|nr:hypothetical protein [Alphaproteobacteria bacterium]
MQLLTARIGELETAQKTSLEANDSDSREEELNVKTSEPGLEDLPVDTTRKN